MSRRSSAVIVLIIIVVIIIIVIVLIVIVLVFLLDFDDFRKTETRTDFQNIDIQIFGGCLGIATCQTDAAHF